MAAQRLLSLLPAGTEMVFLLGAGDRLVGRSHECDFPDAARTIPVVSRTRIDPSADCACIDAEVKASLSEGKALFTLDSARIRELNPDLILTQGQCAVCAIDTSELDRLLATWPGPQPEVVSLSPAHIRDLWTDLRRVARALGVPDEGRSVIGALKGRMVDVIQGVGSFEHRPTVACLEWLDPLMGAGNWIPELVELAGGTPVLGRAGVHSDWISWDDLVAADPEIVVALPCGFDLPRTLQEMAPLRARPEWSRLRAVREGRVFAADGNAYFNRPGPRLIDSLELLAEIFHPPPEPGLRFRGSGWNPAA
ncbi:MAG: cobalamin-binding protein [Verrucomicrobia bacterium]|nr:cobalamin-binding protein [Verrucomicrobiota bacterium]